MFIESLLAHTRRDASHGKRAPRMARVRPAVVLTIASMALLVALPWCRAEEEEFPPGAPLPPGYVRSIDAMTTGFSTANSLGLAAEYAAMTRNYDQAMALAKRALAINDNDLDIHMAYAQALEGKIAQSKDPDPKLFNQCVKEWLIVYRNERGMEAGLTRKNGKGSDKINRLFADEEHSIPAGMHLKALVGRVPKANESDADFFKEALKPADLQVTGKLLKPGEAQKNTDPLLWLKQ